ncbi:CidA/LrgA family protein [Pseudomonas vanderleydeniana]|uniref:CidA/LrgA family protein n=1 Tax=Pseudomonas vanderleydeniana TaxID=2745495 RepID=A0A9E6PRY7_9PSED|nr:CidA/LrgA family protein [Pseudomonas vanderleydeniana]QXI30931.1 CidA/LrgA family protein [Pseudomonas vanderleydeniana]
MPILRGLTELIAFQLIGSLLSSWLGNVIPGPIAGLVLLLVYLCLQGEINTGLETAASGLLRCMPLLLVPAAVGVMAWFDVIAPLALKILLILCVSLFPAMIFAGVLMQYLINRKENP